MNFYVNGTWASEEDAKVSVLDRGFLYGDGLFETLLVVQGKPFRARQHLERLFHGCEFLKISPPFDLETGEGLICEAIQRNQLANGLVRFQVTRGIGPRGYSPKGAYAPGICVTLFEGPNPAAMEAPKAFHVIRSSLRVAAGDQIAGHKTCSKLHNVLARAEADANQADESLLLNTEGELTEGSSSNIFWMECGNVFTPPLSAGILPGVTRQLVFEICARLSISCSERAAIPEELFQSEGVFLTMSSLGIVEVTTFENHSLAKSKVTSLLFREMNETITRETGAA